MVLLFVGDCSFSQIITVKDQYGTIKIDIGKKPVDATAAKSIQATLGLALPAATQNANDAKKEQSANDNKIKALSGEAKAHQAQQENLGTGWGTYAKDKQPYDEELGKYNKDLNDYNNERIPYENTPADQRSKDTYNRLHEWAGRLNDWKGRLDNQKKPLDEEFSGLKDRNSALENAAQNLLNESNQLQTKANDIRARLGIAYLQLEILYKYSKEINAILANNTNWHVNAVLGGLLNNANEKLKEKSNMGFDGNKELDWLREIIKPFVVTPNQ